MTNDKTVKLASLNVNVQFHPTKGDTKHIVVFGESGNSLEWSCTCPAFSYYRQNGDCKHIIAAKKLLLGDFVVQEKAVMQDLEGDNLDDIGLPNVASVIEGDFSLPLEDEADLNRVNPSDNSSRNVTGTFRPTSTRQTFTVHHVEKDAENKKAGSESVDGIVKIKFSRPKRP